MFFHKKKSAPGAMAEDEHKEAVFEALNALETALIDLEQIVRIMEDMPMESPPPPYLYQRIAVHVGELRGCFRQVWAVAVKRSGSLRQPAA